MALAKKSKALLPNMESSNKLSHSSTTQLLVMAQLPKPKWEKALADVDRFIELYPGHDPEAYRLRAWIHDYMGNHEEAKRDRQQAK